MPAGTVIPNFFHFKPPYNLKELNNGALEQQHLNQQNVNGLDWSARDIAYTSLEEILTPLKKYHTVLVRGEIKRNFLISIYQQTISI